MTDPNTDTVASFDPGSMSAASLTTQKAVIYRRPWFIITAGAIIIAILSILSDLPSHVTVAQDAASQTTTLKTINADLAPCDFAVTESFMILTDKIEGTLTTSATNLAPALLKNDQTACSFTSGPIVDLGNNIDVEGTPAGRYISRALTDSIIWASSYALAAIDDVSALYISPNDAKLLADLTKQENLMASERSVVDNDVYRAVVLLNGTPLPAPNIPSVPRIPGT